MQADLNQPSPVGSQTGTYNFDSKALARLAQATSSGIAWLLILPDAFALLPNSDDPISYFLRLLGLWLSAAVLWFVSFWGILNVVRLTVAEVTVSASGIKLWRFAKNIPWENIQAIEIAPQMVFSRFFSLSEAARRLTLFESRKSGPKILRGRLLTHNIPSFLFSSSEFDKLAQAIAQNKFDLQCPLQNVFMFEPAAVNQLRSLNKSAGWQRIGITALIAFGLVTVLARKAIVNYSYNFGNKCLATGDLNEAKNRYQTALAFEPGFSAALNNLALAEYRSGDVVNARKHWKRAIAFKPDYVEAKISLAHLSLQEREFEQANSYIEKALNIAPLNPYATLKRAEYNMRLGRSRIALTDARAVTTQNPSRLVQAMAVCLIAQAKLRMGEIDGAQKTLSQLQLSANESDTAFNCYHSFVQSELALAQNDMVAAEKYARLAVTLANAEPETVCNLVHILVLKKDFAYAEKLATEAVQKSANSPFGYISLVEVATAQNKIDEAKKQLLIAEKLPSIDAYSSRLLAAEAQALGLKEQEALFLKRAQAIDPNSIEAKKLENLHLPDAKLFSSR